MALHKHNSSHNDALRKRHEARKKKIAALVAEGRKDLKRSKKK